MGDLAARAFTEQALLDAWDEVRDAALADGQGGSEVDQFEAAAARHVSRLSAELADGSYQPHPVVAVDSGGPGGRITSLAHSDPTARRAQYRLDDPSATRVLAVAFVDGKIANMRVALLRAGRRGPTPELTSTAETLAATRLLLADTSSYDEILGHEGSATRECFTENPQGPDTAR